MVACTSTPPLPALAGTGLDARPAPPTLRPADTPCTWADVAPDGLTDVWRLGRATGSFARQDCSHGRSPPRSVYYLITVLAKVASGGGGGDRS
jgi:hypothetical protein